jgi:hypothetical protein
MDTNYFVLENSMGRDSYGNPKEGPVKYTKKNNKA